MATQQLLLVDANIISHALTETQTAAYVRLFSELERQYKFVVTGFTKYEVTRSSDKTHRDKIEEYIEQNMIYVTLSKPLMDFAARLHYLYTHHTSTRGRKIPTGDVINAAFSIAKPSALLTIDNNDYPTPFFKEIERHRIVYQSRKDKETFDTVYILEPDNDNTKECFTRHNV